MDAAKVKAKIEEAFPTAAGEYSKKVGNGISVVGRHGGILAMVATDDRDFAEWIVRTLNEAAARVAMGLDAEFAWASPAEAIDVAGAVERDVKEAEANVGIPAPPAMIYLHSLPANVPVCPVEADLFQTNDGRFVAFCTREGSWQGWLFLWTPIRGTNGGSWISWRKASPEDEAAIRKARGWAL